MYKPTHQNILYIAKTVWWCSIKTGYRIRKYHSPWVCEWPWRMALKERTRKKAGPVWLLETPWVPHGEGQVRGSDFFLSFFFFSHTRKPCCTHWTLVPDLCWYCPSYFLLIWILVPSEISVDFYHPWSPLGVVDSPKHVYSWSEFTFTFLFNWGVYSKMYTS